MRLATSWIRYKGGVIPAGGKLLGADVAPTGFIDGGDNIAGLPLRYDQPSKRLVVVGTYAGAGPAPTSFTFNVYAYESNLATWFLLSAAPLVLTLGQLTYVPLPSLVQSRVVTAGSKLKLFVHIIATGTEANGVYNFSADGVVNE
jgi:hypothetical protein